MNQLLYGAVFGGILVATIGHIGDLHLTGLGWLFPLIASALILVNRRRFNRRYFVLWLPWFVLITITGILAWDQVALQRSVILLTPVLVGAAAASLKHSDADMDRLYWWVLGMAAIVPLIIFFKLVIFEAAELTRLATESITCVAIVWVLMTHFRVTHSRFSLFAALAIITIPLVASSRGPFIAGILAFAIGLPFSGLRRAIVQPLIGAALLAVAVFAYPPILEKMFFNNATLSEVATSPELIRTSGRLDAWGILIQEIASNPFVGHGANASEVFLVSTYSEEFSHPHNDYLRLLFDYGVFGLVIFLGTLALQFRRLVCQARAARASLKTTRAYLAYSAASLFMPFLLLMSIDNILLYAAFFGGLHFLFIGIIESRARARAVTSLRPSSSEFR